MWGVPPFKMTHYYYYNHIYSSLVLSSDYISPHICKKRPTIPPNTLTQKPFSRLKKESFFCQKKQHIYIIRWTPRPWKDHWRFIYCDDTSAVKKLKNWGFLTCLCERMNEWVMKECFKLYNWFLLLMVKTATESSLRTTILDDCINFFHTFFCVYF